MLKKMAENTKSKRAWQRMLSGRRLNLIDPSPLDIEIEDIARGLSRVARWNGQTAGIYAFSVAEHSILVEKIFKIQNPNSTPNDQLAALLHDAAEYVIGDMISPFKAALGLNYKSFETRLEEAINIRFGLPSIKNTALKKKIKQSDLYSAWFEATQIAGFTIPEANKFFLKPPLSVNIKIKPVAVEFAEKAFLNRFNELNKINN
ncbi:HD family hydrolase [Hellea sp.]|nr:HD family hydrolase [Hellea sp.]MDC1061550.1 HD family hydrolase [Hellea sp.]MDC1089339.1 HD family hydrolase [Hellea sp.]